MKYNRIIVHTLLKLKETVDTISMRSISFSERNLPINFLFYKVQFIKPHLWAEETVK